jgi:hypothetical protein
MTRHTLSVILAAILPFYATAAAATVVLAPDRAMDRPIACRVDPARPDTCLVGARRYAVPPQYTADIRRLNRWPVYILIDRRGR